MRGIDNNIRSKIIDHTRTLLRFGYLLFDFKGVTREVKRELKSTKNAAADLGDCLSIYRAVKKIKPSSKIGSTQNSTVTPK